MPTAVLQGSCSGLFIETAPGAMTGTQRRAEVFGGFCRFSGRDMRS